MDAIDDGLSFLGEGGKKSLYYQIEKRYQIRSKDIPQKLDEFHQALYGIFGYGASIIEILIVKKLYSTLALEFEEHNGWHLTEYIAQLQKTNQTAETQP